MLILSIALVASGKVRWVFFPGYSLGLHSSSAGDGRRQLGREHFESGAEHEEALYKMNDKMEQDNGYQVVKTQLYQYELRTSAFIFAELTKGEDREVDGVTIAAAWREQLPELLSVKNSA